MDSFIYDEKLERELENEPHALGEVRLLESITEPGMVALDIGANKGLTTVALARAVVPGGHVYAFEPVPEYYALLQANLSRNSVDNVKTLKCGVSNKSETVTFYKDGEGSGIVPQGSNETISVNMTTLDTFARQEGLDAIDVISMDAEGSELFILQGGEATLHSGPLKIFCEIHRQRLEVLGQTVEELVDWLEKRGFHVQPVFADDLDSEVGYEKCTHIFASR